MSILKLKINTCLRNLEEVCFTKKETISLLQRPGLRLPDRLPRDGFVYIIIESNLTVKLESEMIEYEKSRKELTERECGQYKKKVDKRRIDGFMSKNGETRTKIQRVYENGGRRT